jgi:hypothetical protein
VASIFAHFCIRTLTFHVNWIRKSQKKRMSNCASNFELMKDLKIISRTVVELVSTCFFVLRDCASKISLGIERLRDLLFDHFQCVEPQPFMALTGL